MVKFLVLFLHVDLLTVEFFQVNHTVRHFRHILP